MTEHTRPTGQMMADDLLEKYRRKTLELFGEDRRFTNGDVEAIARAMVEADIDGQQRAAFRLVLSAAIGRK
jgi:hypothetical protein